MAMLYYVPAIEINLVVDGKMGMAAKQFVASSENFQFIEHTLKDRRCVMAWL